MSEVNDDILGESYTWVNFKFKTIRIVGNTITSHNSSIKAEMLVDDDASDQDVMIALEKIHFWFDQIVPLSVLFCRDNEFAFNVMFGADGTLQSANFPMAIPEEPTDDYLALVFHSKLNALAGDSLAFGMIEIQSDTREQLTCTFTGYGELFLPDMDEWVGERAFHSKPWWARNDGSTLDIVPPEDADLKHPPLVGVDLSFIEQRFRQPESGTAIVIRPEKFKPEVIIGGKDKPEN